MTRLEIVNAVLRRLREDTVASVTENDYSTLIGEFVNEIKREIEDSCDWTALRQDITVTTSSGTDTYSITGSGERFRILSVLNDTQDSEMIQVPYKYMKVQTKLGTRQSASAIYYNIYDKDSNGDAKVQFDPLPNTTDSIVFSMVVPQADLNSDTDVLTVPSWPVVLGTYARAVSERGEDNGTMYAEAIAAYNKALGDAIAQDVVKQPVEMTWSVC